MQLYQKMLLEPEPVWISCRYWQVRQPFTVWQLVHALVGTLANPGGEISGKCLCAFTHKLTNFRNLIAANYRDKQVLWILLCIPDLREGILGSMANH